MADFRVKTPAIDPTAFATVLQRKSQIDQANAQAQQERKDSRIGRLLQAVQTGQQIATGMVDMAQKKQDMAAKQKQANAQQDLTNILGETPTPTPFGIPAMDQQAQVAAQADKEKRLMQALSTANPNTFDTQMAEKMFSEKNAQQPDFQAKSIAYNGNPMEALFDPHSGDYYDPVTKEKLSGKITPYGVTSSIADIRRQALRDKQTETLGKDLNDLSISSNSPAGISAKRALYAKSGLNLIKQTESQPGGADKRQMAELQMEVARVLTGQGVITNEQLNGLATRSAQSKVKNWEEWLSNKPTGIEQQAFVARFKDTLERQADFHGKELDRYKQKSMAKFTTFEKQAPEEFYASLEQAGFDPEKYKKTRKLVPSVEIPTELDALKPGSKSGLNIDMNALDAEIKRRKL